MSAFLKAIGYAALLSVPAYWFAPLYQSLLIGVMSILLGTSLEPARGVAADLSAANLLAVFIALCLASGFASWGRRLAAIACGIPVLVALECASGIAGMSLGAAVDSPAATGAGVAQQLLELGRWIAVPLVWAVMLGRPALGRPRAPRRQSADRRLGGRPLRRAAASH